MEFLTLHDLSRQLDTPERNVRYRFNQLKFENKLVENEDYIKDEYVDETHFTYKINPVTFVQKTGLKPTPIPNNTFATNVDTKESEFAIKTDNKESETVTKSDSNVATNHMPPDIATDFIAVLKEQLRMKDEQMQMKDAQLERVQNQVNSLQEINNMAMSEVVQLNRTIRQLAAPKSDTNEYQEAQVVDSNVDSNGYQNGYQTATNDDDPAKKAATPESVGEGGGT
jgi:hypothetical protein